MRARAASLLIGASVSVGIALASCNDDGRTLRDPRPDQMGSVSTLAEATTSIDANFPDTIAIGDGASFDTVGSGALPLGSGDIPVPVDTGDLPGAQLDGTVLAPWQNESAIPIRYTCGDLNVSPALSWSPSPTGTVEIAITLVDRDAPSFVHWVMSGIDPFSTSLAEGIIPEFATVGVNSNGQPGHTGPCPPPGEVHTYVYTVHFLDQQTELTDNPPGADLQAFVNAATFASLSVVGTYSQV
jgi:Raf kinase inhibitor-like YbhB/YbcL family protein